MVDGFGMGMVFWKYRRKEDETARFAQVARDAKERLIAFRQEKRGSQQASHLVCAIIFLSGSDNPFGSQLFPCFPKWLFLANTAP
jgi:hypothetical protein